MKIKSIWVILIYTIFVTTLSITLESMVIAFFSGFSITVLTYFYKQTRKKLYYEKLYRLIEIEKKYNQLTSYISAAVNEYENTSMNDHTFYILVSEDFEKNHS